MAEATLQGPGQSGAVNTGLGITAFILPIAAIALAVIYVAYAFSRGGTPGPWGNNLSVQQIDVRANSPLASFLGDLSRFSDSKSYLQKNSSLLSDLKGQLTVLAQKIQDGDSAFGNVPPANLKKAQEVTIPALIAKIDLILASVGSGDTKGAAVHAAEFSNLLGSLQQLMYDNTSLAALARQVAEYNKDGTGPIAYSNTKKANGISRTINSDGYPTYMDCSGFLRWMMQKAGYLGKEDTPNVNGFWAMAGPQKDFALIVDRNDSGLPYEEFLSLVANGTIQPGDLILRSPVSLSASSDDDHILMYVGGPDDSKAIVHSTSISGKKGPQFAALTNLKRNTIRAIIRPVAKK